MIQRIISTATLALAFIAIGEVSAANKYTLVDNYAGTNFFDMFDYYTGADPSAGYVSYTSKEVAENANSELGVALTKVENGQAYMGVDYVNAVTAGRPSVRIQSKKTYTHGLIIADLAHMPASICGTWPAFRTVNSSNYPQYGEIDILENVNEKTMLPLHALVTNTDPNSYGTPFNDNGGGVYAMQWTSDVIRIWNFGPDTIPADITAGTPDPSTWTLPAFTTEGGVCNIDELFANHKIVFDTSFCGGYAGKTEFWQETTCYDAEKYPTCDSYVRANPAAYKEAYWLINSVKVYQNDSLAATSAAAASSEPASTVSTKISATVTPTVSSAAQAESLLGLAASEVTSIASVVTGSSSASPCVSTGVLLSGQTACPEASVEEPSSTDVIASTSSVASIVRSASSVEASSLAGVLTSSIPYPHTTSTIYGTNTRTDELGSIVTETIILSTTICPITATEGRATPSPSSRNVNLTTTTQTTTGSIKSAATLYSTITLSGEKTTLAAENTTSTVVILQTDTVIPEAYTSQVSVAAYTSSTTSTQEISTAIPIRSSPSVPASADSDGSVPTSSTGANSGETTSISSAACVASGALVSGETACPELPIKAINTSIAISSQTFNTSISAIKAPTVLSMATVTPIQSTPTPVATSVEGVITLSPAHSSNLEPSTSTPTNSTSFQTTTSSTTSATATNIAIDTATQGHIETFTFAIPSAYSPTGTSDSSAVTGYSYVDSGVSRVRARGSLVIAMG
ncbi:hypothetical protein DID88_005644 [Monilinia fructigena]|uniref:GH16 domain-containing protein n=1 Tax=Monilinia fructigena TaxID=38457 RepID=A0A395J2R9_9HELO|nr:hypothetical protein DID88_005644 [Monilinia fructigena]